MSRKFEIGVVLFYITCDYKEENILQRLSH